MDQISKKQVEGEQQENKNKKESEQEKLKTTNEESKQTEIFMKSLEIMRQQRFIELKRYYCVSRPQYKFNCSLTSLVSCWNYLFSKLGCGTLEVATQEELMIFAGFPIDQPFYSASMSPGNDFIIDTYNKFCLHQKVKGSARIFWRQIGKKVGSQDDYQATLALFRGLQDQKQSFIYHIENHYITPIGFEIVPINEKESINVQNIDIQHSSLIVNDTSNRENSNSIETFKMKDVILDLSLSNPQFFDIQQAYKGVQTKPGPQFQVGGQKHGMSVRAMILLEKFE